MILPPKDAKCKCREVKLMAMIALMIYWENERIRPWYCQLAGLKKNRHTYYKPARVPLLARRYSVRHEIASGMSHGIPNLTFLWALLTCPEFQIIWERTN
jgi:hypothetical protein